MAYTIYNTNGTILLLLADGQVDKSATSLTLIGKNYPTYGQELNNNFVKLLGNFANSSGTPPRSPLTGQLWYDTTLKRLKVYDNGFKTVGTVNVSSAQPSTLQTGDLWFDTTKNQLKIYSSGFVYTVGPNFPSAIGETGLVLPGNTITDRDSNSKNVVLLKSYGTTIGLAYHDDSGNNEPFDMDYTDLSTYVPNATTSTVVSGITIVGDLNVSGKIKNDYLSITLDLDIISPTPHHDALAYGGTLGTSTVAMQNPAIASILNKVFPPNYLSTTTTSTTALSGIFLGTQARVICKYSQAATIPTTGYQIRVFRTVGSYSTATWEAYYFSTATIGSAVNTPINYIR